MALKPELYHKLSRLERREKRLAYIKDQGGKCWYCEWPLEGPSKYAGSKVNWWRFPGGKDFLKYPVHLHHDHTTGFTIGAVHAYCNAVSFDYDEEPLK
jgi:hypothetical protein